MRKPQLIRGHVKPRPWQKITIQRVPIPSQACSWWMTAPRDQFTARAEHELPRMRVSKFATVTSTWGAVDPSLKKRNTASAWVEYEF